MATTKRKKPPTPAQLAARAKFAAAARAGKFKRARKTTRRNPSAPARKALRRSRMSAPTEGYMVSVDIGKNREWVIRAYKDHPVLGAFDYALVMSEARAAAIKSRLDAEGFRNAHAVPIERIQANPRNVTPASHRKTPAKSPLTMKHEVMFVETMEPVAARDGINLFHLNFGESKGAAKVWRLPEKLVASKDFQAWARGMNYVVSATLPQLKAKLARFL